MVEHGLGNRCAQLGHALREPRRDASSVQREISGSGALHISIVGELSLRFERAAEVGCLTCVAGSTLPLGDICHLEMVMIGTTGRRDMGGIMPSLAHGGCMT